LECAFVWTIIRRASSFSEVKPMSASQVVPGLYMIAAGPVNAYLLESTDGCVLIDTGLPGSSVTILDAVKGLGKQPGDIKHIVITHAHPDHIGGLAALKKATGADAYIHKLDAPIAEAGKGFRAMKAAPGLLKHILFTLFVRPRPVEPAKVENFIEDQQVLPFAGGLTAHHAPGHCAGQVALLWPQHGGVLIAADACSNMGGLGWSLGYEDLEEGKRSLRKLCGLNFSVACFGHGKPILNEAHSLFQARWG
jgi:glyoxylase-like metal-dependent hydrolase (beta-lactamase superfamily II)